MPIATTRQGWSDAFLDDMRVADDSLPANFARRCLGRFIVLHLTRHTRHSTDKPFDIPYELRNDGMTGTTRT